MPENEVKLTKLAKCAGCGAKVGAGVLAQLLGDMKVLRDPNLLVGFDKSDDASVYRLSEELALVQTVDFFPPIADDPYTFGAIAATNALSDVYAMGGEPRLALNIRAVPKDLPKEAVHEILRGGYEKAYEAGVIITGGHSILDPEPKYGLAVTGFVHPEKLLRNSDAHPGDVLFLSSVSGRTARVVDLAYEAARLGVKVIAFTSMEYAVKVDPVHPSGKKLYEIATLTLDNCAPAAEAMLDVEGIEAKFGAASGIASDYIMWSVTSVAVEKLLEMGITPGILKSANYPGGNDYNKTVVEPNYAKFGW